MIRRLHRLLGRCRPQWWGAYAITSRPCGCVWRATDDGQWQRSEKRERIASMSIDDIIARLDALTGEDAERDHAGADELLLLALTESGNAAVVDAYDRLVDRASFWATAW